MKHVALKDIAEVTGLSVNSVSRALNNKDGISDETRAMVQRVAKEMGYIPNSLASSMRSGKTYSIAILLGEIMNPYNAFLMNHLISQLHEHGYTTLTFVTNQQRSHEDRAIQDAISKNVDAMILCTQLRTDSMKLIEEYGIPFVQIGLVTKQPTFYQVSKDEFHSGYIAAKYLLENGHRDILYIVFPTKYFAFSRERIEGFRRAHEEFGVPFDEERLCVYYREDTVKNIMERMLRETTFTAVVAGNDVQAWQVVEALRENGREVPRDCAVVGFDDLQSFIQVPYKLTTVASDLSALSHRAVDLLMSQLDGETEDGPRVYTEKTYLVEGQST